MVVNEDVERAAQDILAIIRRVRERQT